MRVRARIARTAKLEGKGFIQRIVTARIHNGNLTDFLRIHADRYPYTEDLQRLEACSSNKGKSLLQKLTKNSITTPLVWRRWSQALEHHPDRAFRDYIVTGLKEGFRIGFKDSEYCPAKSNMRSALEQPHTVLKYLQVRNWESHGPPCDKRFQGYRLDA